MRGAVIVLICIITFVLGDDATENVKRCSSDHANERLLAHEDCNKFYQCVKGNLVAHKCAFNLRFNDKTQQCVRPDSVECAERRIDEVNTREISDIKPDVSIKNEPSSATIVCARFGSDGILVAHEYCNKFYICHNGIPVTMPCPFPPILMYNPINEQCDWPSNVNCKDRIILDDESDDDGYDHNDDNGNDGDDDNEDDNLDDNNNGGNYDPSEAPSICSAEGSNGILVAHEYCNKFYICDNGYPVTMRCSPTLLYNPSKEQCDWPKNVNCGNRIIPDDDIDDCVGDDCSDDSGNGSSEDNGNSDQDDGDLDDHNNGGNDDPSKAPSICAAEGSDGILVAHEYCNKFYICHNGLPVTMQCYPTLLYNPSKEQCDWPRYVNCGNRIIPDGDNGNGGGDDDAVGENDGSEGRGEIRKEIVVKVVVRASF